jgi:cytochrome c-type biogenesis protein CcmH
MRVAALVTAICLSIAAPAAACPRTSLGEVEREVMCLECGVPLDIAENSLQANQERAFITRQIAACRSKDDIKAALAAQYGDRVLASPKAKGFGLTAVLVPLAALLAAVAAIALTATRWRRRKPTAATPPTAPTETEPTDQARLEADLGRYDL